MRKGKVTVHPEVLTAEMSTRYWALISPVVARTLHVVLVGAGAIGSHAAVALAKMGVKRFTVWDMDTVEPANVGVQMYTPDHVGMSKTAALDDVLGALTAGAARVTQRTRFRPTTALPATADVVIASLDNIPTRELVWGAVKRLPPKKRILYVDPRMGAETYEVRATVLNAEGHGFTPADEAAYEKSFHRNVPPAPCGANSTPYCAMACGAAVAAKVKQFIQQEPIHTWTAVHVPNANVVKGGVNAGNRGVGDGGAQKQHGAKISRSRANRAGKSRRRAARH